MPATETESAPAAPAAAEPTPAETASTQPSTQASAQPAQPGKTEVAETYEHPVLMFTLIVRDAKTAITFYEKALGGKTLHLYRDHGGKVMHSVVGTDYGLNMSIGDYYESEHLVQPAEEGTGAKNAKGAFNYVSIPKGKGSADECVERMREAGAEVVQEPKDEFYGHRVGKVVDVYGVGWVFAHDIEKKDEKK